MYKLYTSARLISWWDSYWSDKKMQEELKLCVTDGLRTILGRFLTKDMRILEAGCGLGKWVIYLKERGFDIKGLEKDKKVVIKGKLYKSSISIAIGDVTALPFADNSFDAYLSFGVIEHFENGPQKVLQEALRVLGPGGLIIIETPYNNYIRRFLVNLIITLFQKLRSLVGRKYYFSEYRYTRKELERFLKQAGVDLIASFPKDDTGLDRSIGIWIDFPFLRAKGKDEFQLNLAGSFLKSALSFLSPWTSSACVVCIGKV